MPTIRGHAGSAGVAVQSGGLLVRVQPGELVTERIRDVERPLHSGAFLVVPKKMPRLTGLAFDEHEVIRVVVAEEEQERHRAVAAHQLLVDVDTVLLQLGMVGSRV